MPTTIKSNLEIPRPPSQFDNSFKNFYHEFIEPSLPSEEAVYAIHEMITKYVDSHESKVFITRHFGNFKRAGFPYKVLNDNILFCGDNEPALWFYARAFLKDYSTKIGSLDKAIKGQNFPISFVASAKDGENKDHWKNWKKEYWEDQFFSGQGWYHAHLFDAARGLGETVESRNDLIIRMTRLLHPANHFPMPSHTGKKRRFVSTNPVKDMSEQPGIKAFIFEQFKAKYKEIFDSFLKLTAGNINDFAAIQGHPQFAFREVLRQSTNESMRIQHRQSTDEKPSHEPINHKIIEGDITLNSNDLVVRAYMDLESGYANVWKDGALFILNTHKTIANVIKRQSENTNRPIFVQNMNSNDRRIVSYGWLDEIVENEISDKLGPYDIYFKDVSRCSFQGSNRQPPGYYYVE